MIKNNNNTPYVRKKISSTLLPPLSAIIIILLATSPLLFFNPFQPVQAQNSMTFKTPEPAGGELSGCSDEEAILKFDAQGTSSSSDPQSVDITGGTFQVSQATNSEGGPFMLNGTISDGIFTNSSSSGGDILGDITMYGVVDYVSDSGLTCVQKGDQVTLETYCTASGVADIIFSSPRGGVQYDFEGAIDCSSSQGGGDTQSSSPMAESSRDRDSNSNRDGDGDRDGIPDSSDRCPHNSHHRCFKEGDTTSTTTTQQEQPSTSSSSGNQTR